jgi:predicted DNA-binding transcriptional regulator AlpA
MSEVRPDPNELIGFAQIEAEFGVHRSTIYRHTRQGRLKKFKRIGDRRVLYRRGDIALLLEPQPVQPDQQTTTAYR